MHIIDTFLFSESYESDLLYLKFLLEEPCVSYWIIQESEFTLKGEYKGLHAEKVLQEPRFRPFLNRIVISQNSNQWFGNDTSEGTNFRREGQQRMLCYDALRSLVDNYHDTYVLVSDTDELIDFSSEDRKNRFFQALEPHNPVWIGRMRYWYDYDNRCYLPNITIPVVPLHLIINNPTALSQVRHYCQKMIPANENPIAFEYSYVFKSLEELWRKKETYSHTGFTVECLQEALRCNHWPRPKERGEKLGDNPYDYFETVELTEENSPKYVRDNLATLKTNIVNSNYKLERKICQ